MNHLKTIVTLLATLLLAAASLAQPIDRQFLLEPDSKDLTPNQLMAPSGASFTAQVQRVPVRFDRALSADEPIELRQVPHTARSKEFWREVDAAELANGVLIHTAGSSALIRINPAAGLQSSNLGEREDLDPLRLAITSPKGKRHHDGEAMDLIVDSDRLQAAGAPFAEGTSAFRLKAELGAGSFSIQAQDLDATSGGRYVIHVLDQASNLELDLQTHRSTYLQGETMRVSIRLGHGDRASSFAIDELQARVVSPSGDAFDLPVRRLQNGAYRAKWTVDARGENAMGLWEVHVFAQAMVKGKRVERGARTAFGAALPSARLTGEAILDRGDRRERGMVVGFEIENVASTRYEIRGLLFGTDRTGELRPLAIAHSASWLDPGLSSLELVFEKELFAASELTAPYEIRNLQLVDQARMAVLQRQALALQIVD